MKRGSLAVFLTGLLLAGSVQALDYTYTTNGCCAITITRYIGDGGAVTIPDYINSLPVTGIGSAAFFSNTLTAVTISTNVASIADWAFYACTSLESVTIPNSVTNIGSLAFLSCTSLTNAAISAGVINIGTGAFAWCPSLIAITVDASNSVYSSVGGVLFNKTQTMLIEYPGEPAGSYIIPSSVSSLGDSAFRGCNVTSVTIPNSVTTSGRRFTAAPG